MDNATQFTGKVKWFSNAKGFGFITNDNDQQDVFVHFSSIKEDNGKYRTLNEGQKVKFQIEQAEKGFKANNVEVIQ